MDVREAVQEFQLNDGDLYKFSRTMGHATLSITERYLRAVNAQQARQGQSVLDRLKETL